MTFARYGHLMPGSREQVDAGIDAAASEGSGMPP